MSRHIAGALFALWLVAAVPNPAVSLDVRDASMTDVIALLARESGVNLVADQSVGSSRVTLRLMHVPFMTALDILAGAHGLSIEQRGAVLVIGAREALNRDGQDTGASDPHTIIMQLEHAQAQDVGKVLVASLPVGTLVVPDSRTNSLVLGGDPPVLERARMLASALDSPLAAPARIQSVAYRLRYSRAGDVARELKAALSDGAFVADDQGNAVLVTGDDGVQQAARQAIEALDIAGPEVLFEVRVADVTPANDSSNIGLEFGGVDAHGQPIVGGSTYAFAGGSIAVNVRLNALLSRGHAQILATPRLVTLNGKEADLLIGETYPVVYNTSVLGGANVQFVDIGVKLRLTPIVGPDGSVTAELHPEYSELQGFTSSGYPIIASRKIDSTLRVRSGQTIVLGGLLRDVSNETIERIPWLSDIPILGKLFENRQASHERDEIVFLITPHVISADAPPTR
jgi:type IV pilus assembly protein PilQ